MPGRQTIGGELYRYAFQGQEKDPETGKEAFQLRLWDSRIGRWLTTDPYGQYHSPYMGMDNRPMSSIDPDGGCTDPDSNCGWFKRLFYSKETIGNWEWFQKQGITNNQFLDNVTVVGVSNETLAKRWSNVGLDQSFLMDEDGKRVGPYTYDISGIKFVMVESRREALNSQINFMVGLALPSARLPKVSQMTTTSRLQSHVDEAVKTVDALGDAAFSPRQLQAIQRNSNLRPMFRGNRIDRLTRQTVALDPKLQHLGGSINRGPDFHHLDKWWDITTPAQWKSHVIKYGEGGTLLPTQ